MLWSLKSNVQYNIIDSDKSESCGAQPPTVAKHRADIPSGEPRLLWVDHGHCVSYGKFYEPPHSTVGLEREGEFNFVFRIAKRMWGQLGGKDWNAALKKLGDAVAPPPGDEDEDEDEEYYDDEDDYEDDGEEYEEEDDEGRSPGFGFVGLLARALDQNQQEYEEEESDRNTLEEEEQEESTEAVVPSTFKQPADDWDDTPVSQVDRPIQPTRHAREEYLRSTTEPPPAAEVPQSSVEPPRSTSRPTEDEAPMRQSETQNSYDRTARTSSGDSRKLQQLPVTEKVTNPTPSKPTFESSMATNGGHVNAREPVDATPTSSSNSKEVTEQINTNTDSKVRQPTSKTTAAEVSPTPAAASAVGDQDTWDRFSSKVAQHTKSKPGGSHPVAQRILESPAVHEVPSRLHQKIRGSRPTKSRATTPPVPLADKSPAPVPSVKPAKAPEKLVDDSHQEKQNSVAPATADSSIKAVKAPEKPVDDSHQEKQNPLPPATADTSVKPAKAPETLPPATADTSITPATAPEKPVDDSHQEKENSVAPATADTFIGNKQSDARLEQAEAKILVLQRQLKEETDRSNKLRENMMIQFQEKEARLLQASSEEYQHELMQTEHRHKAEIQSLEKQMANEKNEYVKGQLKYQQMIEESNAQAERAEMELKNALKKHDSKLAQASQQEQRSVRMAEEKLAQTLALLDDRDDEITRLKATVKKLESSMNEHEEGVEEAEQEVEELQIENEQLQDQVESLEAECAKLKEKVSALENDMSQLGGLQMELTMLREERDRERAKNQSVVKSTITSHSQVESERDTALAEVMDLKQQLTAARADLDLARVDQERIMTANTNLQSALEAFQDERQMETNMLDEQRLEAEEAVKSAHEAAMEVLRQTHAEEIRKVQYAAEESVKKVMGQVTDLKAALNKLKTENTQTRRSLDEAIHRLQTTQEDVIDRTLMKNILLDWCTMKDKEKRHQVLQLMASVLHFNDEEKEKVHLTHVDIDSVRAKFVGALAAPIPRSKASLEALQGDNVSEKWVNFLMSETEDGF